MSFRKLRYNINPSAHFVTRDDRAAYKAKYGNAKLSRMQALLMNAKTVELDHYSSSRYWRVVWKSFWQPLAAWALNKRALRYYGVVASLGLGYAYVRGVRPDLFGLAPRQHFKIPAAVQRDFDELKRDLGMEDRRIRLVISRDFASAEFDEFTDPYVYGSPRLPHGATVCLPSVYFESLPSPGDGEQIANIKVDKAVFDWETVNGVVLKRKLKLPRDELRFVMATSLVEADENLPLRKCLLTPALYIAGIFTFYGVVWAGVEHARPTVFRSRLRLLEAVWTAMQITYLAQKVVSQRWAHTVTCEERVATVLPELALSGADYLDRIAVCRNIVRNQIGQYATRYISDTGDRLFMDWDFVRDTPSSFYLLNRSDMLRDVMSTD